MGKTSRNGTQQNTCGQSVEQLCPNKVVSSKPTKLAEDKPNKQVAKQQQKHRLGTVITILLG